MCGIDERAFSIYRYVFLTATILFLNFFLFFAIYVTETEPRKENMFTATYQFGIFFIYI